MKQKNINILYWIAMAGLLAWFAYTKGWIFANFDSVTAKEASALLQKENNVTLLDVRTSEEFSRGYIRGAKLVPVENLEKEIPKLQNLKKERIIVYCQSGNRSVRASRILANHHFTPLNMKGGYIAWIKEGLPAQ